MTKAAALHQFWSAFGLLAFEENSVPGGEESPAFPYISYEVMTDAVGAELALSGSLWTRDTSWRAANAKVEQISAYIGKGGVLLETDGGKMWIRRGTPFAASMGDPSDELIKRKKINVIVEFLTRD